MTPIFLKSLDLAYAVKSGKILFRNVSFEFTGGDIICLLGNNGAGKSTLLKVCAGLLEPSYGQVSLLKSQDDLLKSHKNRKSISWLPQQLIRPENFNVIEFISLSDFLNRNTSYLSNELSIDYDNILRDFDLMHLKNTELVDLSGGEWKRVQLARIWASKAKVLFLDEPESDLDARHKHDLIYKCKLYARENQSIIFITSHDLFFAREIANKICALSDGLWVWNSDSDFFWRSNILQKLYGIRNSLE